MRNVEDIYLCQSSDGISCGACCGLYNAADSSRNGLSRLLKKRSKGFAGVPRDMESVLEFGRKESENLEIQNRPMQQFHHCPYLGFIGPELGRVGCLLHPLGEGNNGIDFRGLSHYGSMTCGMYFCPSHYRLAPDLKRIIQTVADDWYLYGMILQEADLLEAFYVQITGCCQTDSINLSAALVADAQPLWKQLFSLKLTWPFAFSNRPLANYFFNDNLYARPLVDYWATGQTGSKYDVIFRYLYSVFNSTADLKCAEQMLDGLFEDLAEAINA